MRGSSGVSFCSWRSFSRSGDAFLTMKGDIGSIRFSMQRQASMKVSTFSIPRRSMWRRTRVAWLAIPSIIRRLVLEKK